MSFFDKLTGKDTSKDMNKDNNKDLNKSDTSSQYSNSSLSSSSNATASSTSTGAGANNMAGTAYGANQPTTAGRNNNLNNNMRGADTRLGSGYSGTGTNTDDAMTRSEEQLHVGKEAVGAGRAALDKYVTTEHVEKSVPVQKERVIIEREPINDRNRDAATRGAEITEAHHEVNLTEERAIGAKETVPIERIRLGKQHETQEQTVGADLRKEHVDLTTTGIGEKFDNVGYGVNTGTKIDPTTNTTSANTRSGTARTGASNTTGRQY